MKKIIYALLVLFIIQNIASAETAETLYAKAYSHIYRNSPKQAIGIFEKAINTYPNTAFLYAGMGDAYLKEGNYSKAIDSYTKAQKEKNSIDIYKIDFYNANIKMNMNDISIAINTLLELTKHYDNPTLFENINCLLNEKYDRTKFILEIYTDEDILVEANNLKQTGKYEKALQKYLQILSANPKDYKAANNAGVTLIELRDYQLAEKYLLQALNENKNSALILTNLAVATHYQGNFSLSNNYFTEAYKAKSDYAPIKNNEMIAKIYKGISLYQHANINAILDIAKKDNENYYAWRVLSKMYFLKGDYKNANNALNQLQSPYNYTLYEQKAFMAYKNKNYSNALSYINSAISLYSGNSSDYILRGRIYDAMGNCVPAQSDYNMAIGKDKNNIISTYYAARAYYNSGNSAIAMRTLKEFIDNKKGNSDSQYINMLLE